jgi:cytochrome c peroxidase
MRRVTEPAPWALNYVRTFSLLKKSGVTLFPVLIVCTAATSQAQLKIPDLFPFLNPGGILETRNTAGNGQIDTSGPFFQSLGTNGRSCFSCHKPDQGWSISADSMKLLFALTAGNDPVFRPVDGSNCDRNIDTSSVSGRAKAYSLLTSRGLIRVALTVPDGAEYRVVVVHNPYGCSSTSTISTYRRPLPTTNLKFLSAVMWDGRESTPPATQKITFATNPGDLEFDLRHQAADAVAGHAQGVTPLSPELQQQIADFESHLFSAQAFDFAAGSLNAFGATGGPVAVSTQPFFIGINDPLGGNPTGATFTPEIFTLFRTWANTFGFGASARASVSRGEALFNSKPINITGVAGLNDVLNAPVIAGNCGTCHSSPNAGNHSLPLPIDIGIADTTNSLGVSYLPVVTLQNIATGQTVQTTDPGRALITGKWSDIGKFKGPVLRALASRAPYFHNGSAASLGDVLDFYDTRFAVGFTAQERADLIAFLKTL